MNYIFIKPNLIDSSIICYYCSTYDLLLDGALLNVELTLLYANGKEVDEFTIYGEAFDSDTTGYGKFQKTGKNGK